MGSAFSFISLLPSPILLAPAPTFCLSVTMASSYSLACSSWILFRRIRFLASLTLTSFFMSRDYTEGRKQLGYEMRQLLSLSEYPVTHTSSHEPMQPTHATYLRLFHTLGIMPINMSSWSESLLIFRLHMSPRMAACMRLAASTCDSATPMRLRLSSI